MKIKINEIQKTLEQILIKHGYKKSDAKILADDYIEGELQGKKSHGIGAILSYASQDPTRNKDEKTPRIIRESEAYLFVDACASRGALVGRFVANKLLQKAKMHGIGFGLIKNMKSWLRPGSIAQYAANKGYVALVVNSGGQAMMSPPGGYEPVIGTNPIGIGIPTQSDPLVIDMATSKRAWREIKIAMQEKRPLPPDTYLDKKGNVTQDPTQVLSVLPMGDHKGFGLGLFIEILCGSLVHMPMGLELLKPEYAIVYRGAMILIINPKFSTSPTSFKKANSEMLEAIRKTKTRADEKEISIPGDRSRKMRGKNIDNGYLEIEADLWKKIAKLTK